MNAEDKKAFRRTMLAKRDAVPYENRTEADKARNERIRSWETYKEAELLLFYVSYRSEADTLQLIREALADGRNVAVPKVVGTDMVFYRITEFSQLIEGYKGILEPDRSRTEAVTVSESVRTGDKLISTKEDTVDGPVGQTERKYNISLPEKTILFVPGCAFDEAGGRMGYGGGFYDRFMEQYPDALRVALAYESQLVPEVPREAHDKLVDVIVTELRTVEGMTK